VEKYGTPTEATGTNIIRLICIACWITKATDTHSECVYNNYCFYTATMVTRTHLDVTFISTLPVLFIFSYEGINDKEIFKSILVQAFNETEIGL
jgi:hypothetical protein